MRLKSHHHHHHMPDGTGVPLKIGYRTEDFVMNAQNNSSGGFLRKLLETSSGPQLSQSADKNEPRQWSKAVTRDFTLFRDKKIAPDPIHEPESAFAHFIAMRP